MSISEGGFDCGAGVEWYVCREGHLGASSWQARNTTIRSLVLSNRYSNNTCCTFILNRFSLATVTQMVLADEYHILKRGATSSMFLNVSSTELDSKWCPIRSDRS